MRARWSSPRRSYPQFRCGVGLLLGLLLFARPLSAAEITYVVKRQDTLTAIAQRHQTTASAIAQRNKLALRANIYPGQRLIIPVTAPLPKPVSAATLSRDLQTSIATAPVKSRRWRTIVIHHAAVNEGTLRSLDRYHREQRHMENGLAYHFLIGNGNGMGDGEIAVGPRWKKQLEGGHLRSAVQNQTALGICLIGNFDEKPPTARQLASLEALTRALLKRCQLPASTVKTHQQINVVHTRCPGRYFPTRAFLARLKQPEN